MRKVSQTITIGDGSGRPGNCLSAAVASLLDLPLDEVPHFLEMDGPWDVEVERFARSHGYRLAERPPDDAAPDFGLAYGHTRRGPALHAVVVHGGEVVWDPHPERSGLTSVLYYVAWEQVLTIDPECQKNGCPDSCHAGYFPPYGCGGCCDCLGGCRIAYYRQQEAREQETP